MVAAPRRAKTKWFRSDAFINTGDLALPYPAEMGLEITKEYSLDSKAGKLVKTITLHAEKPKIIAVESRSIVDESFRKGAFYTQWLHHIKQQRLFIPASEVNLTCAAAPRALMQSQMLLLTNPDLGWTYGEVPLWVDSEALYPAVSDEVFGRKTLLTPNGWQLLRGIVEPKPGEKHTRN